MRFRKRLLSGLIAGILVMGTVGMNVDAARYSRSADSGGRSRQLSIIRKWIRMRWPDGLSDRIFTANREL